MNIPRSFRRHVLSAAAVLVLSPPAFAVDIVFSGGTYAGPVTIGAGDTLNVNPGSYKYLNSGLTNNGTVKATDDLYFQGGNVLTNNGLFDWKTDAGLYDGGYNGGFVNTGTLRKSGGTGTSYVSISGFSSSGTIDAQTGTIAFNAGAVFNNGSAFTGAGQVVVTSGASVNGSFTTAGNLTLGGGTFNGTGAVIGGDTHWTAGSLTGDWTVQATRTLSLDAGSYKYLAAGLNNNGTIAASDTLYMQYGNVLTNGGTYLLQGDVSIADGGYNGSFINNGTLRKASGANTSYVSISGFSNNGTIDVQTGTLNFNTGAVFNAGTAFTGAGQVVVSNGATFNGAFTTAGNLTLAGGTYAGNAAKINGDTIWTAGSLTGSWEVAAGRSLSVGAGSYKYLGATLVNNGTISADDDLYLQYGNVLTNNGSYLVKGDFGVADGGYNGSFVNNGTFQKTSGTGTTNVSITGFSNNGVIEARTGTIAFTNGAAFNAGTQFTGAGQVVVTNGANFAGSFTTANNLTLTSGQFNGSTTAPATLAGGSATMTGGTLAGNWQTAAGTTLNLATGAYKYLNGNVANGGTVVATDDLYLQNGGTLTNNGVYQAKGDVGVFDGGYNGHFVNNGTFLKDAGTGSTSVAGIDFQNAGTVDVRSGTVVLPTNFSNPGILTGSGALTTNLLTNSGHIAPGTGAGTLTLNGSFAQTTAGSLDIELASSGLFDLFAINGTASLHGALALSCIASCDIHSGDVFTILDATGDLTGTFDSVTTAGFLNGFDYSVIYDYNADLVKLMVLDAGSATPPIPTAVPEPGTWALMFAGLGAVGAVARRRGARR